jgi:phage gp36-like protein
MTYCTTQDLVNRFGELEIIQLSDFDGLNAINQSIVDQAIADSDGEINSALRARYKLPLLVIPPELLAISCDIVRYRLMRDDVIDAAKDRYNRAVIFLRDLANGKAVLPVEVNDIAEITVKTSLPKVTSSAATFSDSLLNRM